MGCILCTFKEQLISKLLTISLKYSKDSHNPNLGQLHTYDVGEAMMYRAQTVKYLDVLKILNQLCTEIHVNITFKK